MSLLIITPTKTFNADTHQSHSKLRKRIILLLCLLIERVDGVIQFSEEVLSDLPSSILPKIHTHFCGGTVGKASNTGSQVVTISDCPVFHKFLLLNLAPSQPISCFILKSFLISGFCHSATPFLQVCPNYSSGLIVLILCIYLFL